MFGRDWALLSEGHHFILQKCPAKEDVQFSIFNFEISRFEHLRSLGTAKEEEETGFQIQQLEEGKNRRSHWEYQFQIQITTTTSDEDSSSSDKELEEGEIDECSRDVISNGESSDDTSLSTPFESSEFRLQI